MNKLTLAFFGLTTMICSNVYAANYSCTIPDGKPRNIQIRRSESMTDAVYIACLDTVANCDSTDAKWLRAVERSTEAKPAAKFNIEKPSTLFGSLCWTTYTVTINSDSSATLSSTGCTDLSGTKTVKANCTIH